MVILTAGIAASDNDDNNKLILVDRADADYTNVLFSISLTEDEKIIEVNLKLIIDLTSLELSCIEKVYAIEHRINMDSENLTYNMSWCDDSINLTALLYIAEGLSSDELLKFLKTSVDYFSVVSKECIDSLTS